MFLPKTLMDDVVWSFVGEPFDAPDEFALALKAEQADIAGHPSFDPAELVLLHPAVVLLCEGVDEDGDDMASEAVLAAEDGHAFSAAELLFKAHNAFVAQLDGLDHHFFEGLWLEGLRDGRPVYRLRLGS